MDRPLRSAYRKKLRLKVHIITGKRKRVMESKNISTGGMFLLTDRPIAPNKEITVSFTLPTGYSIQAKAVVIHNVKESDDLLGISKGIGIKFLNLSDIDIMNIKTIIF